MVVYILEFEVVENIQGARVTRQERYLDTEDHSENNSLVSLIDTLDVEDDQIFDLEYEINIFNHQEIAGMDEVLRELY